jgi:MFS family permease
MNRNSISSARSTRPVITDGAVPARAGSTYGPESRYAWVRLAASVLLSTIGGVGMWSVVVMLPAVQNEFGVARAEASLPYTLVMLGFVVGGIMMGRLADRFGVIVPVVGGSLSLSLGYILASFAGTIWQFAAVHGLLIGLFGSSATFGPVIADISHWFTGRRGLAVSVCASGSYLAGTVWPPVVQHFVETAGWRQTHFAIGIFCAATMLPLALVLRRPPPKIGAEHASSAAAARLLASGAAGRLSPNALQAVLSLAGVACCVAMSMPQVHIVAYCSDLGYGSARGATMLSLMLGFGIVSRLASGWISDRFGALTTLLLGSSLQALSLLLYLAFDSLTSLYVVSAAFGLFQGGIVPSYALIAREHFPPSEAGMRVGIVLSATLAGMALGGWMSGAIFDATLSYRAAFLNGFAWNVLNVMIVLWLMQRLGGRRGQATAAA